jgi:CRISPR-associated endoribonuclease Cas6
MTIIGIIAQNLANLPKILRGSMLPYPSADFCNIFHTPIIKTKKMRLKLQLSCRPNGVLSLNYHYALQAVIYKTLQRADPVFSAWLHEHGHDIKTASDGLQPTNPDVQTSNKRFKLFTFSDLQGLYRLDFEQQTIQFRTDTVEWEVSFWVESAVEKFITGLFQHQQFAVITPKGSIDFTVQGVEISTPPTFEETMRFRALTPICIAEQQIGRPQPKYLAPDEPNYDRLFLSNLDNKLKAAKIGEYTEGSPASFKMLSGFKKRGIETVKAELNRPIKVIGYTYDFELTAPIEVMKMGYEAGFGIKNSGGLGFVKVLN